VLNVPKNKFICPIGSTSFIFIPFYSYFLFYENAAECPALWAGMNAAIPKSDTPDILVRQPHFRRDWKVSAIREAPPCGRGASLLS